MPIQTLEVSNDLLNLGIDPDVYQYAKGFLTVPLRFSTPGLTMLRSIKWHFTSIVSEAVTPRNLPIELNKTHYKFFKMKFEIAVSVAFVISGLPFCLAWGNMGHQTVAYIASNFGRIYLSSLLPQAFLDCIL